MSARISHPASLARDSHGARRSAHALRTLPALALGALLAVLAGAPLAEASLVAREEVSLGRLVDASDLIVQAEVSASAPSLELQVLSVLKGQAGSSLTLPASRFVTLRPGQRALFFLRRDPAGGYRPLVTEYQRILLHDAAQAAEFAAAVGTRLISLGGASADLPRALFAQLSAGHGRLREDAAWDLLALPSHAPSGAEAALLLAAIQRAPSVPLLALCARWPASGMLAPVLDAARQHPGELRTAAGAALQAIDPAATLAALEADLRQGSRLRGLQATQVAGALEDAGATRLLRQALVHQLEEVRLDAIKALARRDLSAQDLVSLEAAVWGPSSRRVASAALAALALTAPGASLKRVATQHADPELRRLADALRREPVRVARPFLR